MRGLLIGLGMAVAIWAIAVVGLMVAGRRSRARELVTLIPNLIVLFRGLLRDPRVPRRTKVRLWFAVGWVASPIDLVPEFIPIAGPLDDVVVAALVLKHVLERTDRVVVFGHRRGNTGTLESIL